VDEAPPALLVEVDVGTNDAEQREGDRDLERRSAACVRTPLDEGSSSSVVPDLERLQGQ